MAVTSHKKKSVRKRVARKGVRRPGVRSSPEKRGGVVDLRKQLHLRQLEFARLLPVSLRSLATLEKGTRPTPAVARRLTELRRLTSALSEVIRKESLGNWLQTPNDAFDGLKPIEVIDRGEADRIWSMIYFLRSGVPT